MHGELVVSLTFVALFAAMIGEAVQHRPDARLAPLAVGIPALLLALAQFGLDLRERARKQAAKDGNNVSAIAHVAWFAGLVALSVCCGVLLAFPVFVTAFLIWRREVSPGSAVAIGVGFTAVTYVVFEQLLGLYLWRGLWSPLLG